MQYGVIPSTVHFLYESIKTDSICVAHVTIYLSAKKGKRVTMNWVVKLKHLSKTVNKNQITLTEFSYSLSCTVTRKRHAKIKKKVHGKNNNPTPKLNSSRQNTQQRFSPCYAILKILSAFTLNLSLQNRRIRWFYPVVLSRYMCAHEARKIVLMPRVRALASR